MTDVHELPRQERRYDEASLWIARLDKGLSAEETRTLQAWMAADPENAALLASMARTWDKLDSLSRLAELFPVATRRRSPHTHTLGIAASVLLAVLIGAWAAGLYDPLRWGSPTEGVVAPLHQVYETAIGEHSTVMLLDGTQMMLNTNSRVRVEYSAAQRLLTLERGEVNAKVARDEHRPLSVIAGRQIVQAVGTQFNVKIKGDRDIELIVMEGTVRVGELQRSAGMPERGSVQAPPHASLMVSAGEELSLRATTKPQIKRISPQEIDVKLSWRDGNLIFQGESLEQAIEEISRYTSIGFVFVDDELRDIRIAGRFKTSDVDGLLVTLGENFKIAYRRVDDRTVLLGGE